MSYRYIRPQRHAAHYRVLLAATAADPLIGYVTRNEYDGRLSRRWIARLVRDPLITGYGRTRAAAVNAALEQVGGLG